MDPISTVAKVQYKCQAISSRSVGLFALIAFVVLYEKAADKGDWCFCGVSLYDAHCEW